MILDLMDTSFVITTSLKVKIKSVPSAKCQERENIERKDGSKEGEGRKEVGERGKEYVCEHVKKRSSSTYLSHLFLVR